MMLRLSSFFARILGGARPDLGDSDTWVALDAVGLATPVTNATSIRRPNVRFEGPEGAASQKASRRLSAAPSVSAPLLLL